MTMHDTSELVPSTEPSINSRLKLLLPLAAATLAIGVVVGTAGGNSPATEEPQSPQPSEWGASAAEQATVGPIDFARAARPDGSLDPNHIPDLIPASGPNGEIVGYIAREELFPHELGLNTRVPDEKRVVDLEGGLLGYMVPNVGYVTLKDYEAGNYTERTTMTTWFEVAD